MNPIEQLSNALMQAAAIVADHRVLPITITGTSDLDDDNNLVPSLRMLLPTLDFVRLFAGRKGIRRGKPTARYEVLEIQLDVAFVVYCMVAFEETPAVESKLLTSC